MSHDPDFPLLDKYVNPDGTVTLHHYGPPGITTLDPSKFGLHSFTANDAKVSRKPRTFFYTDPSERESHLFDGEHYTAQVPASDIYDMRADERGLVHRDLGRVLHDLHKIHGYKGVYYNTGRMGVVNYFEPLPVEQAVKLARHPFYEPPPRPLADASLFVPSHADPYDRKTAPPATARPEPTQREEEAIKAYTGGGMSPLGFGSKGHAEFNKWLRSPEETPAHANFPEVHEILSGLFARTPVLDKPHYLYRGWSRGYDMPEEKVRELLSKFTPGKVLRFPGYQSTHYFNPMKGHASSAFINRGNDHMMAIIKARHMVDLSHVKQNYSPEREALLPHNSKFRVLGVHETDGKKLPKFVLALEQLVKHGK